MFYLIGLGLSDEKDITIKGLEIVKRASRVYLEAYTSIIGKSKDDLEIFYERNLILADRELVEQNADEILRGSDVEDVALLVVGDPFGATTHADIILRAKERNIKTSVIHNASIINAVACCGLQIYSFGEIVSIPYWTESWKPKSFMTKILRNKNAGLHTLCLLDIQVKEPTVESLTKKRKVYHPPKFMSVNDAARQLLSIVSEETEEVLSEDCLCVALGRVGSETQKIIACTLAEMLNIDLGNPLHSLVIVGQLHPLERDYLSQFFIGNT